MRELSIEEMQALMKAVADNRLDEFCYEAEGLRLRIRGQQAAPQAAPVPAAPTAVAVASAAAQAEVAPAASVSACIKSPLVGTFYASSGPDEAPFVTVGQKVRKGDVVFIVESMKVMNEIPADAEGTVAEILVENGAPVEYGQPVLRLE